MTFQQQELRTELLRDFAARSVAIRARLDEFRAVPEERYFYELAFCLLTPQSKAVHCNAAVKNLEAAGFQYAPIDPEPFLAPSPDGYVRFHKTKAKRLIEMKHTYPGILALLRSDLPDKRVRDALAKQVKGLGLKEASHFLRNTGRIHVTILDRHILRYLTLFGILEEKPGTLTSKRYHALEDAFEQLAREIGIPAPEFDLLLWSRESGVLLK